MKFGVCGDFERAAAAADAGYDYMEWSVPNLLKPQEDESAFQARLAEANASPIPYTNANGFIPGELKITGPDVDMGALTDYVTTAMKRAEVAGIGTIVFGSGGARRIPDGFDTDQAHGQLVEFCKMCGPLAADHGVTIVIEPLNLKECNVLTTVGECADLAREVDHPGVKLLADSYHMMQDDDPWSAIVDNGDILAHTHIATKENRRAPAAEPCDLSGFFDALNTINYTGGVSIEGGFENDDLPAALEEMRRLAGQ